MYRASYFTATDPGGLNRKVKSLNEERNVFIGLLGHLYNFTPDNCQGTCSYQSEMNNFCTVITDHKGVVSDCSLLSPFSPGLCVLRLRDFFHARLRQVPAFGGQGQGRQQAGHLPVLPQPC